MILIIYFHKNLKNMLHIKLSEGSQARSKAADSRSAGVGHRRFKSGPSHLKKRLYSLSPYEYEMMNLFLIR